MAITGHTKSTIREGKKVRKSSEGSTRKLQNEGRKEGRKEGKGRKEGRKEGRERMKGEKREERIGMKGKVRKLSEYKRKRRKERRS